MTDSYPVLTVRQPWAWAIEHGKPVENRGWNMKYRGPLWLHAGARSRWDAAGQESPLVRQAWAAYARSRPDAHESIWRLGRDTPFMTFGAVTSLVEVIGCHESAGCCRPWSASDGWHIGLQDVRLLPEPVPCRGSLGLWRLPPDVEARVREQLEVPGA